MKGAKLPIFAVRLQPEPCVADPTHALRAALKALLRRFGLRALAVQKTGHPPETGEPELADRGPA